MRRRRAGERRDTAALPAHGDAVGVVPRRARADLGGCAGGVDAEVVEVLVVGPEAAVPERRLVEDASRGLKRRRFERRVGVEGAARLAEFDSPSRDGTLAARLDGDCVARLERGPADDGDVVGAAGRHVVAGLAER